MVTTKFLRTLYKLLVQAFQMWPKKRRGGHKKFYSGQNLAEFTKKAAENAEEIFTKVLYFCFH
jgi:hypothetical protein